MEVLLPYISPIFVPIGAVRRIRDAVEEAMISNYPSYVVGDPGLGKSTALYHLAAEFDGVYCQISEAAKSISGMYRALLSSMNQLTGAQYERELFDTLVRALRRNKLYSSRRQLLIIDEFQALEDRAKRELLKIQEGCDVALVISGNAERLISSGTKDPLALQQIESRIGLRVVLPGLDDDDCDQIGGAYGVEGLDTYRAVRALGGNTNVRTLCRTLQSARRMAGETAGIRLIHVKHALQGLYGKPDALKLLVASDD